MERLFGAPPSGDAFRDNRRSGIGGSDAAAILGVSPYRSALGTWERKRGIVLDDELPSERMLWGSRLERAIIDGYEIDHDIVVKHTGRVFRRHPRYRFVVGHPDGIARDRIVEVKTTARLDERWGDPGSADIPAHFYAQVQHYMLLVDMQLADVAALVGGRELHVYTVPADPEFQEAMLDAEALFWKSVVDGVPPEPDGSEDAAASLRRMFPRALPEEVVATPEMSEAAADYLAARSIRDAASKKLDESAQRMQSYMGSREKMLGDGFVANWFNTSGSTKWREVAASYRDLLVPHYDDDALDAIIDANQGASSRRFSVSSRRSTS